MSALVSTAKPHIWYKFGTWRARDGLYMGMGSSPRDAFAMLRKISPTRLNLTYNERRHG